VQRWRNLLCALSTLTASLALSGSAHADPAAALASLELSWDSPAQCPSRESLLESLSLALGDSRSAEKVQARARIRRDSSGSFVLSLGIRSGKLDNVRTVRDPSCSVVAEAAVVMLVLAIDPARALTSSPVASSEEQPPEGYDVTPADPTPPAAPAEKPSGPLPRFEGTPAPMLREEPERSLALGISVGPAADFGTFGRPTMGALAGVQVSFVEKFRVDAGFVAWMPVQLTLEDAPYGVRISAMGAAARGCFLPISRGTAEIGACAGLDLMRARASGFGTREWRSDEATWYAAGAGLIGRKRLSRRIHLVGNVYGTVPLDGPQYGVQIGDDARRIHRVSFGIRAALSVEVTLF
jgi:hypothetical protein